MEPLTITSLVLASLSLVASVVSPIIIATGAFINRIKRSDCCLGGHIELESPKNPPINIDPNQPPAKIMDDPKNQSFMNKINALIKNK